MQEGDDPGAIQEKTNALQQAAMKLGEAMYQSEQEAAAAAPDGAAGAEAADDGVVDAEFEEVDDGKKDT